LTEVNPNPQVHAVCWFVDSLQIDDQWNAFSLTLAQGRMADAAAEFDALLQANQP